jgi:peptide/nickel transport system permease protein
MRQFIAQRLLFGLMTIFFVSIISFAVIQLPPGDYLTTYIARLTETGAAIHQEMIDGIRIQYGLDQPLPMQYLKWIGGMFRGHFGYSFYWNLPVSVLLWDRIPLTVAISLITLAFTYAAAIPIGIYSATHQYSPGDYFFTVLGFAGLATPSFLLALVLMFVSVYYFGWSVGGLFSPEFRETAWSLARLGDLIKHLPIPVIVIAASGTAGLIRVMRATLLDELRKQYVITARAKGVDERVLLFKYPVRIALNPMISSIGWILPGIISGATITAIVLNLPLTGPLLLQALLAEDMFLAGSVLLILSVMVVIGVLLSDILLVVTDPRIRLEGRQ